MVLTREFRTVKVLLTSLAVFATVYSLVALFFIATTPDLGLRCLIAEDDLAKRREGVVTVAEAPELFKSNEEVLHRIDAGVELSHTAAKWLNSRKAPAAGDDLVEVAGYKTRNFAEFAKAMSSLRSPSRSTIGDLLRGTNPDTEVEQGSTYALEDHKELGRLVKVWYRPAGTTEIRRTWLPLMRQPAGGLVLSLVWFVLQMGIFALSGLAFWQRPYDRAVRVYFALCAVTSVAYVGGNHWWVLAGSLWFMVPFAACAALLPPALLHFFLVYPTPKKMLLRRPRTMLTCVYGIPGLFALGASVLMLTSAWISNGSLVPGPLTQSNALTTANLLPWLRLGVYAYLTAASVYFGLSIVALVDSYRATRNPLEHNQVKWILWASLLATPPVAYAVLLAYFDHVGFAFGRVRIPMLLASLSFTLAYTVGIARYKLLLIDQVVNRGMLYYVASFGVALLFALLIAVVGVAAWREATSTYGYAVPVVILVALAVIAMAWARERIQQAIDRWFFREKYGLDRALQRMNRAVSSLLERGDVADNMLYSCCEVLRIEEAALYLRDENSLRFRLSAAVGKGRMPLHFDADDELLTHVGQGISLQRIPSGTSPTQLSLRRLGAQLVQGLDVDGETNGLVALGAKPNGAAYTAEDVTFLTAVGRITSVALHCAKVHEDISRLNQELQLKGDRITAQSRQIAVLQSELAENQTVAAGEPASRTAFRRGPIKGHSPPILHVLDTVRKVSPSDASVLIRGESGTGKELLARAIHENSLRREQALVSVHCAALAPSLLESELFGHVRGAFTDAREDKQGRFALADGGTLFLDEIGDISLDIQVKLLRVLQERTYEPVGAAKPVHVDVRVIAATHRNLEQLISEGRFREDLFYRLNVVSVVMPALRERGDDIFELALFFLRRASERMGKHVTQFDDDVIAVFMQHQWPGNIRELENAIERAVVLAETERVMLDDLPVELTAAANLRLEKAAAPSGHAGRLTHTLAARTRPVVAPIFVAGSDDERSLLLDALSRCGGNKSEAARLLNMPRSTYFSKLKKHGFG